MPSAIRVSFPREAWTSDEGSMAQQTALTRWPKIVQNMVEDVEETLRETDGAGKTEEGRRIQATLKIIRHEITDDKPLHPLLSDGGADIDGYNKQLATFGKITWHSCPWLFSECYLYRCVHALFARSEHWHGYDIFARQKLDAFLASHAAVEELCERYTSLTEADAFSRPDAEAQRLIFHEMTEIALWGNATDLSLLSSLSLDQIHSLQGKKAIHEGQTRIVSNDMPTAWRYLQSHRGRRVDIVLDNAGFELFTDLVYSLYLLDSGLASSIKLHVKSIPWFVSDVMPRDMDILLETLADASRFPSAGREPVKTIRQRLCECYRGGVIRIAEHPFWTTAYDFQQMPAMAPELHDELRQSALVIFKGDLNYRKLVRDANWPYTTPFMHAIGVLAGEPGRSGMKILALRTNKADVCVGVDKETLARVDAEAPEIGWVRNGKYAVVSFSDAV